MPFWGDGGRIEVVDVAGFDPSVLAEGVVDAVFVVSVSCCISPNECAVLEGVVSILMFILITGKLKIENGDIEFFKDAKFKWS